MVNGTTIKEKRITAGIAGHVLCKKLAIARSRLSDLERGYVTPHPEEFTRINAALDELIHAKLAIRQAAAAAGWPVVEVG
jgi:transcriptional regulator with XRE-family HTH domain